MHFCCKLCIALIGLPIIKLESPLSCAPTTSRAAYACTLFKGVPKSDIKQMMVIKMVNVI